METEPTEQEEEDSQWDENGYAQRDLLPTVRWKVEHQRRQEAWKSSVNGISVFGRLYHRF